MSISGITSHHPPQEIPAMRPCRVFLIEDDPDDRILARRELERSEFVSDVVAFGDGRALTDYMRENGFMDHSVMLFAPVLMLVDLEMPRKDGLEVIRELKSDPFLQPIPLVVLTGTESAEKIRQAWKLGAKGVFRKPLRKHMLDTYFEEAWQWPPADLWR